MSKVQLAPYLTFNGKAKEAMEFYESILGGDLKVQTFAETPVEVPEDQKDRVMHAVLKTDDVLFMASDSMPDKPTDEGNNLSMSLMGSDEGKLTGYFNSLKEGGEVTMPLEKQFWGDMFGMVKDKFGINWMVDVASEQ